MPTTVTVMTRLPLAALLLVATATASAADRLYAYAYDLDGGRFLYTEVHDRTVARGQVVADRVRYVLPDGSTLASKQVDYAGDPFVPRYRLEMRDGYAEGVTANGAQAMLMRQAPRGAPETVTVAKDGLLAADAGMLRLLQAHFDELAAGATLTFRVLAPGRLSSYRFRARRIEGTTFEGQPAARVQVEMDSLLKLFAGPLVFTFGDDRRLLEFRGPTNVRNPATGKEYAVRLAFYSKPPAGVPAPP